MQNSVGLSGRLAQAAPVRAMWRMFNRKQRWSPAAMSQPDASDQKPEGTNLRSNDGRPTTEHWLKRLRVKCRLEQRDCENDGTTGHKTIAAITCVLAILLLVLSSGQ